MKRSFPLFTALWLTPLLGLTWEEESYSFMHSARDAIRLIRELFPAPDEAQP